MKRLSAGLNDPEGVLFLDPVHHLGHVEEAGVVEGVNELVVAEAADRALDQGVHVPVPDLHLIPPFHKLLADDAVFHTPRIPNIAYCLRQLIKPT